MKSKRRKEDVLNEFRRSELITSARRVFGAHGFANATMEAIARDAAAGTLRPEDIDVDRVSGYLPTAGLPPLDLLVRTSGEQRISNFMLWEIAYAELVFTDVLWPEFRRQHLYEVLDIYRNRERRFGLTSAQLASDV